MTMLEMYEQMKDALRFFGIQFGQMNEVKVEFNSGSVTFTWYNKTITIKDDDS